MEGGEVRLLDISGYNPQRSYSNLTHVPHGTQTSPPGVTQSIYNFSWEKYSPQPGIVSGATYSIPVTSSPATLQQTTPNYSWMEQQDSSNWESQPSVLSNLPLASVPPQNVSQPIHHHRSPEGVQFNQSFNENFYQKAEETNDPGIIKAFTEQQKQFSNGKPMTLTLEKCKIFAEDYVGKYLKPVRDRFHTLKSTTSHAEINELREIQRIVEERIRATTLFAKQPSRVQRAGGKFPVDENKTAMKILVLAANQEISEWRQKFLNISIIDEETYKSIQKCGLEGDRFLAVPSKGTLTMGKDSGRSKTKVAKTQLEFCRENGCYSIDFRNIHIEKNYPRKEGKSKSERVTDEKVSVLVRLEVEWAGMIFRIWVTSLPIVVTSHVYQNCDGWATVLHDNAMSLPNREGFEVPDLISMEKVLEIVELWFQKAVGSPLKHENRDALAKKLEKFQNQKGEISWHALNHDKIPDKDFTTLEFILEAINLVEAYFRDGWSKGYVRFMSSPDAESTLSSREPGTFILRISDSYLGGISASWCHSDKKVPHSFLGQRIDFKNNRKLLKEKLNNAAWLHVYQADPNSPQITKEEAFKKVYEDYAVIIEEELGKHQSSAYVSAEAHQVTPALPQFSLDEKDKFSSSHDSGQASSSSGIGSDYDFPDMEIDLFR